METTKRVPETILKQRRTRAERLEGLRKARKNEAKQRKAKRAVIFKRAQKYIAEYREQERSLITLRRQAKLQESFFLEPEPKLILVIRILGINGIAPKPRKILQLFRLLQINNAVFVRANGATLKMLKYIEPYVTYGYPSLSTVRSLIYKRGYGKIRGQRVALTDNRLIEASLKKQDILCMEDLVHEIYTVGPNFRKANSFLWPFKLRNPAGGWTKKLNHFIEGGDAGNREHYINKLVARMI